MSPKYILTQWVGGMIELGLEYKTKGETQSKSTTPCPVSGKTDLGLSAAKEKYVSVNALAESCGMELVWPASFPDLPHNLCSAVIFDSSIPCVIFQCFENSFYTA